VSQEKRNGTQPHGAEGLSWNRMITWTARSLPSYLQWARPWVPGRFEDLWDAVQEIAGEHREFAARLAEHVTRRGGLSSPGNYPEVYPAWHDLALDFLAEKMIQELLAGAAELDAARSGPPLDPDLAKAAESLRDLFRDEAERLQSLLPDPRRSPSPPASGDAA